MKFDDQDNQAPEEAKTASKLIENDNDDSNKDDASSDGSFNFDSVYEKYTE